MLGLVAGTLAGAALWWADIRPSTADLESAGRTLVPPGFTRRRRAGLLSLWPLIVLPLADAAIGPWVVSRLRRR